MIKKIITLLFLLSIFSDLWAQETIVPGGNNHQNNSGSISWSLGQTAINTLRGGNQIITQGFQQTRLTITSVDEVSELNFSISIYPNPTQSYINLDVDRDDFEHLQYTLVDLNGKILKQGKFDSNPLKISFTELKPAVYLISVSEKGKELKTFRVVKQ